MSPTAEKTQLAIVFQEVRSASFEEKKEAGFDEKKMNAFLDAILDFKDKFVTKTEKIETIIENVEAITWFNDLDNESLMLINDLVSAIKDLHSSLIRQYISLNLIRTKGIAKNEIKHFKSAIDDLKEVSQDLESRFFFLPKMEGFQETTKALSLI